MAFRQGRWVPVALALLLLTACGSGTQKASTSPSSSKSSSSSPSNYGSPPGTSSSSSSSSTSGPSSSSPSGSPQGSTTTTTSVSTVQIKSVSVSGTKENVLTTSKGQTLYYYTPDTATQVACGPNCVGAWPPLTLSSGTPTGGPGVTGKLAILSGVNGPQVTYNGHPLYTYAGDDGSPGQANGQGVAGSWYVVTPNIAVLAGSSSGSSSSSGSGW